MCRGIALIGCVYLAAAPAPVSARAGEEDDIVVTARRQDEKQLDVPLSVASVPAEQISTGAVRDLQSLSSQVPGLFFESIWGGGNSFPILRGQNQPSLAGDNVGMFVDGVYQANRDAIDGEMVDLERIEVVKGPQSALFGRSSFAGLIHYVPAQPGEQWSVKASADFATDHYLGARGAFSGPLGKTFEFRLAAGWRKADGTWSNDADPMRPLGNFQKFAAAGTLASRDGLGPFSFRLHGRYFESRLKQPPFFRLDYPSFNCGGRDAISGAWSYFCGKPSIPDRLALSPGTPDSRTRGGQVALHLSLDLGGATVRSDTSFYEAVANEVRDFDGGVQGQLYGVCLIGFNCTGPSTLTVPVQRIVGVNSVQLRRISTREYGQELRLVSAPDHRLGWQLGAAGFWTRSHSTASLGAERGALAASERLTSLVYSNPSRVGALAAINQALVDNPNANQVLQTDTIDLRQTLSLFATADWRATSRFGLRGEIRANWERLKLDSRVSQFQPGFGTQFGARNFFTLTPRFGIDYRPAKDWLVYASYARGSRSGGINTVVNLLPEEQTFAPETNWTAEIGVKFAGHGLLRALQAAAYHIDWRDTQIIGLSTTPGITALITRNTRGIETWGAELAAQVAAAPWLLLDGAISYTHPRFRQGSEDPGSNGQCGLTQGATTSSFCRIRPSLTNPVQLVPDISGNVPARSVAWSWTAGMTLAPKDSRFHRLSLHLGLSYQGNDNDRQIGGLYYGEHILLDARLSLPLGRFTLELWGTNLTDARYIRLAAGSGGPLFFTNQPRPIDLLLSEGRRVGLTLRYAD